MSNDERESNRHKLQTWFLDSFPLIFLVVCAVAVAVVVVWGLLGPTIGNVYSNVPAGRPCSVEVTGKAWLDKNSDGKEDANEPPLSGVQFSFNEYHTVSDQEGMASSQRVTASCGTLRAIISAISPTGYRLTTAGIITSTSYESERGPFLFGFTDLLTTTVRPQSLTPAPRK